MIARAGRKPTDPPEVQSDEAEQAFEGHERRRRTTRVEAESPPVAMNLQRIYAADGTETAAATVGCPACHTTVRVQMPEQMPEYNTAWPVALVEGSDAAMLTTTLEQVMHRDVLCVRPELAVESLGALFLERSISGAPVVDEEGRPIGVVSKTDIVRLMLDGWAETADTKERPIAQTRQGVKYDLGSGFHLERGPHATVSDIMTPMVISLPADAKVSQAAALMAYEGIHRLVVVDVNGRVVGLLSALDVLGGYARRCGYVVPEPASHSLVRRPPGIAAEVLPSDEHRARTVLLVEDDVDGREAMTDALREQGYAVICAANGKEALEQLNSGIRPRVILLDLMMPVMDGWEFLNERNRVPSFAEIPVVVLSAYSNPSEAGDGPEISGYLQKPFACERLLATVKRHCNPS